MKKQNDTFIEEIGKIFYEMEEDTTKTDFDLNQRNIKRRNEIMSLLKSSLQSHGKFVSTVWLGLDYQFEEGEPPLIFETMVFPMEGNWDEEYCERYSTLEEAEEGHRRIVNKYK